MANEQGNDVVNDDVPPALPGSDSEEEDIEDAVPELVQGGVQESSSEDEDDVFEDAEAKPRITRRKSTKPAVDAPRIGGVLNGVAWTGGKPNKLRKGTDLVGPRTPYSSRPTKAAEAVRIYAKQTDVRSDSNLFKRTDPLSGFENLFLDHLERTGMDSIVYIEVPGHAEEMINVIIKHSSTTVDQVEDYLKEAESQGLIDGYEKANDSAAKGWLLASLDPHLRATLHAKLDRKATCMVVWMTLVAEIRSESYRYFENVKSQLKSLKLSDYPGENVKDFTHAFSVLTDELETANLLESHMIIIFITALTKTDVTLFMLAMSSLLTRALNYNRTVRFLSEAARRMIPAADVVTIRKIRAEADGLYQELFEGNDWPPAINAGDRQGAPQANMAMMAGAMPTMEQFNALIQKVFQEGVGTGNGQNASDITCYNCNKKGHYANKCPDKASKPPSWKKKAPTEGEPEIKTVSKDGASVIYYWCKHCKRWTVSHNSLKHGRQGDDPTTEAPPAAPAAANMAMDEGTGGLVRDDDSDDDSDGGAWTSV
jgi:hypothetical protein